MKIKKVYIFSNGCVAVLDENEEQITSLQGLWKEKYKEIITNIDSDTLFQDQRII